MGMRNTAGLARLRRRERETRDGEICRLAKEGVSRRAISDSLRISYRTVFSIVKTAGIPVPDARHDRRGAVGALQ
jgi:DNA-binding CsgD family transcriptional regulator